MQETIIHLPATDPAPAAAAPDTSVADTDAPEADVCEAPAAPAAAGDVCEQPALPRPPRFAVQPARGEVDLRARFGDLVVHGDRIIAPTGWEGAHMVTITVALADGLPHRLYINRAFAPPLQWVLDQAFQLFGWRPKTVGCFAPRAKRSNPRALSLHSWGIAVDLDAAGNPPITGCPPGDPRRAQTTIPEGVRQLFAAVGCTWGGEFHGSYYDPMHFQLASGV